MVVTIRKCECCGVRFDRPVRVSIPRAAIICARCTDECASNGDCR